MSEHDWVQENLDAYVADGLSADERTRTEQHVAGCADCTQALTQARKLEATMANLFADAHPDAKLEDRMIRGLRKTRLPLRWSTWMRFAAGVAAAVMLGVVGMFVQAVAGGGTFGWSEAPVTSSYRRLIHGHVDHGAQYVVAENERAKSEGFSVVDVDPAAVELQTDIQYMNERIAEVSVPGVKKSKEAVGIIDDSKSMTRTDLPAPGGFGGGSGGQLGWSEAGGKSADGEKKPGQNGVIGGLRGWGLASDVYGNTSNSTGEGIVDPANLATKQTGPNIISGLTSSGTLKPDPKKGVKLDDLARSNTYYGLAFEPAKTPPPPPHDGPPRPKGGEGEAPDGGRPKEEPKVESPPEKKPELPVAIQGKEKTPPPPQVDNSLKIIRTGQMDFEVDSFDKAVAVVGTLIKPLLPKGGFILTSNSEKQANGKTRGQVVVRMRPENLDEFVLDLRRDLGKMGDLKMQHIGSQDVTKQYTDTESELKAARAVEKRLLGIIENSKGDVKDFVAAEKELGLWRTKIEKMEGELRYYANQVALSTLTIKLVEKEITAAAALVVSATVKTRIEVDNVTKARETAEKAVEELKGRIVKSDEKQLPAGQVEAILHAEIPPDKKDAFRRVLEKLGIVSAHEDTQTQATEGGTGPVLTPRRKVNDVLFQVTLNNIVNIRPKHSVKLDVVTADVRGNFEKLKDEINRVHQGQIREARLDENQDKQKAVAVIEFNVPTAKKADVDKLIASFGPALDRVNLQAEIKEISTEQKFGYTLKLYSIANVEPRERTSVHVEVKNVEKKTNEIIDLVKAAKGQVNRPKSGLNKQGQTEALLVISVPLSASDAVVADVKEKGKVVNWEQKPNASVPENELATAQIVVLLTGPNPIIPSDESFGTYVSRSLYVSFTVFATCLLWIVAGLSFIAPWAALIVIVVWIYRRAVRAKPTVATATPPKAG